MKIRFRFGLAILLIALTCGGPLFAEGRCAKLFRAAREALFPSTPIFRIGTGSQDFNPDFASNRSARRDLSVMLSMINSSIAHRKFDQAARQIRSLVGDRAYNFRDLERISATLNKALTTFPTQWKQVGAFGQAERDSLLGLRLAALDTADSLTFASIDPRFVRNYFMEDRVIMFLRIDALFFPILLDALEGAGSPTVIVKTERIPSVDNHLTDMMGVTPFTSSNSIQVRHIEEPIELALIRVRAAEILANNPRTSDNYASNAYDTAVKLLGQLKSPANSHVPDADKLRIALNRIVERFEFNPGRQDAGFPPQ